MSISDCKQPFPLWQWINWIENSAWYRPNSRRVAVILIGQLIQVGFTLYYSVLSGHHQDCSTYCTPNGQYYSVGAHIDNLSLTDPFQEHEITEEWVDSTSSRDRDNRCQQTKKTQHFFIYKIYGIFYTEMKISVFLFLRVFLTIFGCLGWLRGHLLN